MAMKCAQWRDTTASEIQTLELSNTRTHSVGQQVVGYKWIFKIKRRFDGSIEPYKIHLVAKG